jgi:hypothetical protein
MVKDSTIAAAIAREYERDVENEDVAFPYSPARALDALAGRRGYPTKKVLRGRVDSFYFAENGRRSPFPKSARGAKLGAAILARRAKGGTLSRWDTMAAAASVTLGRRVTEEAVKEMFVEAGGEMASSYAGRGTKARAWKTKYSDAAELDAVMADAE